MLKNKRNILVLFILISITIMPTSSVYAWGNCFWVRIPNSHQPGADWCPNGYIITALDLDGCGYGNMHAMGDCPIIAQARCCQLTRGDLSSLIDPESNKQASHEQTIDGKKIVVGDIYFKKHQKMLWRMFEDENGLYVENLKTKQTFRVVLDRIGIQESD
jgi:hypothetical protein